MIYVDTSVIVAALDPTDPRREEARKALELHDNKIVSELVIAELASVLARQHKVLISIKDKLGLDDHMMASMAIILYILKRFNLKYIVLTSSPALGSFMLPSERIIGSPHLFEAISVI